MAPVNLYDIKRKAHAASRRDSSGSSKYNPFRHIHHQKRASTFDVESGQPMDGEQLQSSQTAPQASARGIPEERFSKEAEVRAGQGLGDNSDEVFSSQVPTLATEESQVRQRTSKASSIREPESADAPDDSKSKRNNNKQGKYFKHVYPKEPFTVRNQIQRTLFNSWINILLLAAPAGIAINYAGVSGQIVFAVNFIAIIPLAALLSYATEEIALRTGETLGGLINATFGNAVELIVAVIALLEHKPLIVQTSLIGSILSNLLLVMGCCFLFGGLRRQEQFFNTTVAQTSASLLALAAASVIVPTVFHYSAGDRAGSADVAALSRGTAVILLFVYAAYLYFQLHTHQSVFNETSKKVPAKPFRKPGSKGSLGENGIKESLVQAGGLTSRTGVPAVDTKEENERHSKMLMNPKPTAIEEEEEEEEDPQLNFIVAFVTLALSTVVIAFCAEAMVGGIDSIVDGGVVSEEFVGLILLPIVGNAAEHATAVTVAIKDKMDLAIGVAVGSSMQVALFLIPLLIIIGWGIGEEAMTLSFDMFQVAVMFVAVLLTNYLIADGKSHWLEGLLLICLYFIIAVCSWWYPAGDVA